MGLLDDGYALLPGFFDAAGVASAREEVERLLRGPRDASCEREHNTLVPLRWDTPLVGRVLDGPAARLPGDDLRWISGYVSVKDPHSEPLGWHQDWWCWDHPVSHRPEAAQVALLIYLVDADERNAALRVRPGSHRGDPGAARTLALAAGDAALIDYRLDHATHANTTAHRRECVILNFAPEWSALPEDIRAHLIQHPALPDAPEPARPWLPRYDGPRRDLALNRMRPAAF